MVKNACEAAPDDSRVTVELKDDTPLRVEIRNTGAVPADIRERFFDKFVTKGKPGGTGLGTYSARLLARTQYGDILLDVSDEENTTTVTVVLPREAKSARIQAES